jgi:hypothetical protein
MSTLATPARSVASCATQAISEKHTARIAWSATGVQQSVEGGMSQRTFSQVAGVVFGPIALGHLLRIAFGWSFTIQNFSVPIWVSALAVVILGYLAYEGFRVARKSWSDV